MSENSKIEWTDHTGGPCMVCTEVSPGCAHCYARELAVNRLAPIIRAAYKKAGMADWETRKVWGKDAPRVLTKGFWKDAVRINAQHAKAGTRGRWFPSMIDWLDDMPAGIIDQDGEWLSLGSVMKDFLNLVRTTPHLDWLLLTKRPERWSYTLGEVGAELDGDEGACADLGDWINDWHWGHPPANIWLGTSVEDQKRADERIPQLMDIPAEVRFLSCEPLLEEVDLISAIGAHPYGSMSGIDWVICGGESGPGARPFNIEWARDMREQCRDAGVAFFLKQLGRVARQFKSFPMGAFPGGDAECDLPLKDPKGGDMAEWPEDLRVREFPDGGAR